MSVSYTKNISGVTESTINEIIGKSAYSLPDVPSSAGFSTDEIKAAFWKPIADNSSDNAKSVLSEVDRVANEAQAAVEEMREVISSSVGEVVSSVESLDSSKLSDIGVSASTPAGCVSLYKEQGSAASKNLRLADAYPSVALTGASLTLTMDANKEYYAGEVTSLALSFPLTASVGDYCYICFSAGATCNVSVQTTNASDISEIAPEFIEGYIYEIMGKWNGSIWMLAVHSVTVS